MRSTASGGTVAITGGTLVVDSGGDGMDSNGSVTMSGGTVVVSGPTGNGNGALDYDGTWNQTGGFLVAAGSSGMVMAPSSTSPQSSLLSTFTSQAAGTVVHIESTEGDSIVTFAPAKAYQSIVVSSPDVTTDASYEVSVGGTTSTANAAGLADSGDYEGGSVVDTTTAAEAVSSGGMGGMGGGPGRR